MERKRRAELPDRIGTVVAVTPDADHAAVIFGVEQVLDTNSEPVALVRINVEKARKVDECVIAVLDPADRRNAIDQVTHIIDRRRGAEATTGLFRPQDQLGEIARNVLQLLVSASQPGI